MRRIFSVLFEEGCGDESKQSQNRPIPNVAKDATVREMGHPDEAGRGHAHRRSGETRILEERGARRPGIGAGGGNPIPPQRARQKWGTREQSAATAFYDVRAFGAAGDGKTIDTPAINRAIEAAAAAGGGTVYFRAGNYLCYSIHLKSRVAIYLDAGATIVAADPAADSQHSYDLAESNQPWEDYQDYGHNHWHNSLIWGEGLEGVSICGPGLIWGKGLEPRMGRWAGRGTCGRGEQSDCAEELPQCDLAGFFNSAWRAFWDSGDGRR